MAWQSPMQRILVPVDLSKVSDAQADLARRIALKYDSEVIFIHVIDPIIIEHAAAGFDPNKLISALEENARNKIEEYIKRMEEDGIIARMYDEVPVEHPPIAIASAAKKESATEILITHKGWGLRRLVSIGNTAREIIKTAPVPVLLFKVRKNNDEIVVEGDENFAKKIVLAVDEHVSDDMLYYLASLAQKSGTAEIYLLNVLEPDKLSEEEARQLLQRVAGMIAKAGTDVKTFLLEGKPSVMIVSFAERTMATSIAMGRTVRKSLIELIFGSTLDRVITESRKPLIIYPLENP